MSQAVYLSILRKSYNLLRNALKFTDPKKEPQIKVWSAPVSIEVVERYIPVPVKSVQYHMISFRDNGIGFEHQYSEQIFEVFKRLNTREHHSGSGIGLALCSRIVGNHHGALFAASELGIGSTFHIILPEKQRV